MGKGRKYRKGSVYLLVLLVMISSLSLVSSLQHVLIRRTRVLEQTQSEESLRTALLLALQEASRVLLEEDQDFSVDSLQDQWMRPLEYQSTEGVFVTLQLRDAQTRFNLNHLTLPITPGFPLIWMDVFENLLQQSGLELEPDRLNALQEILEEEELWFENTELLALYLPELSDFLSGTDLLTALPHPENRPLPLNINTVHPQVLSAILGDSLQGWVDTILETRENSPIYSIDSFLGSLPPPVQSLMRQIFDVQTEYIEAQLTALKNQSEKKLTVLFRRSGEEVEVLRCQW